MKLPKVNSTIKRIAFNKLVFCFALICLLATAITTYLVLKRSPQAKTTHLQLSPAPLNSPYLYQSENDFFKVYLGNRSKEAVPKVGFEANGSSAEFSLVQSISQSAKFEKENNQAVTYKNVWPGIDIKYSLAEKGVKEEIIISNLDSASSQPQFKFILNLKNAVPRTNLETNSPFYFIDTKDSQYCFHIPQPFMVDTSGNRSEAVKLHLISGSDLSGSEWYEVVLEPNMDWLKSAVYPVIIDPTVVHDTATEFAAGTMNRIKNVGVGETAPELVTYYQELPADEHTVGLWHINETVNDSCSGGQDACDSSGNGNHGTATGTTITTTGQKLGAAARSFNGSSNYVNIPDSAQLRYTNGGFSVEAWVYKNAAGSAGNQGIVVKWSTNQDYYLAADNSNGICFIVNGDTNCGTRPTISLNTWNHVVGTVNDEGSQRRIKLYINGVLKAERTSTYGWSSGSEAVTIGANTAHTEFFPGLIDEVRISNVARTPEEIKANAQRRPYGVYTSQVIDLGATSLDSLSWSESGVQTGDGETLYSSTNLVAQWNFNETSGTTAAVAAGSCGASCNGTLTNFASTASQDQAAGTGWTANNRRWGAGALMFDGSNDWVSIPDSDNWNFGTNNFSIETWFKTSKTEQTLFYQGDQEGTPSTVAFIYRINSSSFLEFYPDYPTYPSHHSVASTRRVDDGSWHHGVITRNGITFTLYVDGKQENTLTLSYTMINSASPVAIGAMTNGVYSQFSGVIDSSRLYSRALTAAEILSNYQAGQIEFQTRTGADNSPDDGSWEDWKPTTSESQIESMDESMEKWGVDSYQNSSSTISKISGIDDGDGDDGAITVSANKNINTDNMISGRSCADGGDAVNYSDTTLESAGETSVTLSSTPSSGCLAAGDEFLIINLQGTSTNYGAVGQWETHTISSISTATLNFTDYPLRHTYDGTTQKIMVQRVPNYTNVTVNSTYTLAASAWNGTKGGVLFFRATGTVTVSGTIDMNGKGYRGYPGGTGIYGYQGESYAGLGGDSRLANKGAGGGAGRCGGGGGGGYGTQGLDGEDGCDAGNHGVGGEIYGINLLSTLFFGSGGGRGGGETGSAADAYGGGGGNGGGIIYLAANTVNVSGETKSNGTNGENGQTSSNPNYGGGGGGGGSGGTLSLNGSSLTVGTNLARTTGGAGGLGSSPQYADGGNGGSGRIAIYYTSSLSGTTNPVAYVQKYDSTVSVENSKAMKTTLGAPQVDSATVALWHLEETGGSGAYIKDSTANANNGTPTGPPAVVDGFFGKARSFSSTSDKISTSNVVSTATNNFSIEAWVKWNGNTGSDQMIVYNGNNSNSGWGIYLDSTDSNQIHLLYGGVISVDTNTTLTQGQWSHIVMKRDSGTLYGFLNGSQFYSGATNTPNTPAGVTYIGNEAAGYFFNGLIDEVRISSGARTAEEIAEAYRAGRDHRLSRTISSTDLSSKTKLPFYIAADRPGTYLEATIGESAYANYEPDANTVGLWHLEEETGSGAYIKDSSSSGNDGTPIGTTFAQGKIGKGRKFDGSGDYIDASYNWNNLSNATVELWVKLNATGSYILVGAQTIPQNYIFLQQSTTEIFWHTGGGQFSKTFSQSTNTWYYIVATKSGSTGEIFINGESLGTGTAYSFLSDNIRIGAYYNGANVVNGIIDEVRISDTAHSADDIRQAYEIGRRTHPITIDFGAKMDGVDIAGTSEANAKNDTSITIDSTAYGFEDKGDNLYKGDKVIVRENYGGTEYIVTGTVTAVTASTGAVTVDSWTGTVPNPGTGVCGGSYTHCYTANSQVFKWQREWFDLTAPLDSHVNDSTRITLRVTEASEGRTFWLDDFRSGGAYMTDPSGSAITSTAQQYFQYRAIFSTTDTAVSPSLTSVTIDYQSNAAPSTPTLSSPFSNIKTLDTTPSFEFSTTDPESDDIRYQIRWDTDYNMGTPTTKTSGTDAGFENITTPADTDPFNSNNTIKFTIQAGDALTNGSTHWWQVRATDPNGSNTWSSWSSKRSLTIDTSLAADEWFQTTKEQFDTDTLDNTETHADGYVKLDPPSPTPSPVILNLTILNPSSHPKAGENWEIKFKTITTADLTITPEDKATIDDLEFVSLKCGDEQKTPQILDGDVIFYPNWECLETGSVTHHVNVAGKHTLKFQFGDQIAYAYNALANGDVCNRDADCDSNNCVEDYDGIGMWCVPAGNCGHSSAANDSSYYDIARTPKDQCNSWWSDGGSKQYQSLDQWTNGSAYDWYCQRWDADNNVWIPYGGSNDACWYNKPPHRQYEYIGCTAYGKYPCDASCYGYTSDPCTDSGSYKCTATGWVVGSCNLTPTNDSLIFTNPYSGNTAVADDYTEWNFQAKVTDADGCTNISTVVLRLANSSDNTAPYDALKFTWTESTDTFSETADTQNTATITSTSANSSCAGNQWTLDFKIKFNDNFSAKTTNYNAQLYTTDDGSATDEDTYTDFYLVKSATGTILSTPISFSWFSGAVAWNEVKFSDDETNGDIKYKIYYTVSTTCDTIVPNGDLPGNSTGFDTSPVSISGLNSTTYSEICIKGTLTYSGGTPKLNDWGVSATSNLTPVNDSLTFTNPYEGSGNDAVADDYTGWNFQAKVTDADGCTNISTVVLRLANSSDNTAPYDALKFTWTESTDTFSETADTQNTATITSTSANSSCAGNQWTLDFKIKFNDNFSAKTTNYNAQLYTTDDDSLTDEDTYTDFYQVLTHTVTRLVITLPGQTFTEGSGNSGTPDTWTAGSSKNLVKISATDNSFIVVKTYSGAKTLAYSGPGNAPDSTPPSYTTAVSFTSGESTTTLATTLYKAETTTITATDTGQYGRASSSLTVDPGSVSISAEDSQVDVNPSSIPNDNSTSATITVTAKDTWKNPIPDIPANEVVISSTGSGNTITQPTNPTDASGQTTGTIKSSVAENKTISATIYGNELADTASLTVYAEVNVRIRGKTNLRGKVRLGGD